MNIDDEITRQLMGTFKVELEEHIQAINKALLELEKTNKKSQRNVLLEEVFREAHSLKGAARAVGIVNIEEISHQLENLFSAAKREDVELAAGLFDLIYEGVDGIGQAMDAHLKGKEPDFDLDDLLKRLEAAKSGDDRSAGDEWQPVDESRPATAKEPDAVSDDKFEERPGKKKVEIEETIRVATKKLDYLMSHVEELLVSRIRTEQRLSDLRELYLFLANWHKTWFKIKGNYEKLCRVAAREKELAGILKFLETNDRYLKTISVQMTRLLQEFSKDNMRLSLITEDLQHDIRKVRMLPVSTIFNSYERMVRDIARQQNKEVRLRIVGSGTELDKKILEGVKDPIMHLVRNCIDHGIENSEERLAKGKPRSGMISIRAFQQGGGILIEVEDDGAGISVENVKKTAAAKGLITSHELKSLSDKDALFLIFKSGFSTSPIITNVSGRGVGLDVVRQNVEQLNGLIDVNSTEDKGTKFSLSLPLTLTTSRVLLAKVCGETYAIPTSTIERILSLRYRDISSVAGKAAIKVGDRPISLVRLDQILELPVNEREINADDRVTAITLGVAEKRIAFIVDGLVGETEIVIKSLGRQLSRVRNVSGATILGTGKVVIILNVSDLIKSAKLVEERGMKLFKPKKEEKTAQRVLVVDDSITTRTLEKNILESVGFSVSVAKDGVEAFEALKSKPIDLIISDVDMPLMDGLELTTKIKKDEQLKDLPVILVTALESQQDREKGIEVGADAYIVKSEFDQRDLIETVKQLI